MDMVAGNLYRTKTQVVFFNKNILPHEVDGFDRAVKIPKDSIFLLLEIGPGKRHTVYTIFWDEKILRREIGTAPFSWFEEVDTNVSSS